MAKKRVKRPRDPVQLGKLIGDIATGQVQDVVDDGKDEAAQQLGRRGGAARAKNLTKEQRAEIARKAAKARWSKQS
jgi:ubiquinone biosynthesis protein UbiJ